MAAQVRHVVMFKLKAETTGAQIEAVKEALAGLPDKIGLVRRLQVGEDIGVSEGNGDLVVMVDFDSASDYQAYAADPHHRAFVQDILGPHLEKRMAVQYELGDAAAARPLADEAQAF